MLLLLPPAELFKRMGGRYRPDFLDRCMPALSIDSNLTLLQYEAKVRCVGGCSTCRGCCSCKAFPLQHHSGQLHDCVILPVRR